MEPTHLLCRTQLHEEELRLVKADLVILGKFFELLPSGSDREKIFDSPLFRQVVLEVLRKAFSLAGVLSFFFHQGLYFGYPCMHKYQGTFGFCFPRETRLMPTWTVKPILNHITNHIDYRWARSGLFPLNLLCNPGASALGAPHR